jgi:hypothetical protein
MRYCFECAAKLLKKEQKYCHECATDLTLKVEIVPITPQLFILPIPYYPPVIITPASPPYDQYKITCAGGTTGVNLHNINLYH